MTLAPPLVEELTETDALRREANQGLMLAWINADLLNRAQYDVRTSLVYYDEDQLFHFAMPAESRHLMDTDTWQAHLFEAGARFWSKGIV